MTFWTKEVAAKGWDTLWGAGEKQLGIAQDLVGYLGEERKVGQERGFGDLGRNKSGKCRGKGTKGVSCVGSWLVSAVFWPCPAQSSLSSLGSSRSRTLASGACTSRNWAD